MRVELSDRQEECASATDDLVVVTGGAGVGKTFVALEAANRHLTRETAKPSERVLFTTFSRTAVAQIRTHARRLPAELDDRIEIHTFHSLAYRLINDFGQFAGLGPEPAPVESQARARLLGHNDSMISYDDLLTGALALFDVPQVASLIHGRWSLVICDEFQDTDDRQWGLVQAIAREARLLLLADEHQMIYDFLDGVDESRLGDALRDADRVVPLEEASHRDPSGVIPAMASAVRRRDFGDQAIEVALEQGRLTIHADVESPFDTVEELVKSAQESGNEDVMAFAASNVLVAALGAELSGRSIDYSLIGIPDAQGEGILTQATMLAFGLGACSFEAVRTQLAVFITACSTGGASKPAPQVAIQILRGVVQHEGLIEQLAALEKQLTDENDFDLLVSLAGSAWERLPFSVGSAHWGRARVTFAAAARRIQRETKLSGPELGGRILEESELLRTDVLVGYSAPDLTSVRLMNLHQAKGREADMIILMFQENEWAIASYKDEEPFVAPSRVLYVALTRAKKQVHLILPPTPNEFLLPLADLARARAV